MHTSLSLSPLLKRALSAPVFAFVLACAIANAPAAALSAETASIDLSSQHQAGRMLRLGLEKSAVLQLPVAAKDVIVGNPGMVDVVLKNRKTAYLFARTAGQTNIFFLDAAGQQILKLDVEVTLDTKALKSLIDRSMPGNAIQVDSTGSNIVLKGVVPDAQQGKTAEDLAGRFTATSGGTVLNLLKVSEGNQVMLKVRVIELKRNILKRLGISLDGTIKAGTFNFNFSNSTSPINLPHTFDGIASFPGPPLDISATIRALEDSGLATILAEPTLTAVSGAPARFRAGGEYPYSSCELPDENSANQFLTCTTLFRDYGITLDFTPTVLTEGRIALNVFTEVSDLAPNIYGNAPLIDTRNAQTSIELPSGGSMMLAGLIKNVSSQKMENTPGLRSLPVLGALFSSQEFERKQSELVVIVTPYIVNPTEEKKLATPIDRFNNATDLQQFFLGRLNRVYGLPDAAQGENANAYHGQVGHIIE